MARLISQSVARLPRQVALSTGAFLATIAFWLAPHERDLAYRHIALSLEFEDALAAKRLVRRCFQNMGKNLIEFMQFPRMSRESIHRFVALEGKEHIDRALGCGNGAIILTAHFGNWELLAASLVANGYPLTAIARQLRSKRLDALVRAYREEAGYASVDRDQAVRSALRCLRQNELLGILADVDTKIDGVFVNFFGRLAYTPYSPIAFALKTGAAILPTFIIREPDNSHRVVVEPPLGLQLSGNRERDFVVNTQKFTKVIESYVRRYPEQWIWMHERWKTQPKDSLSV